MLSRAIQCCRRNAIAGCVGGRFEEPVSHRSPCACQELAATSIATCFPLPQMLVAVVRIQGADERHDLHQYTSTRGRGGVLPEELPRQDEVIVPVAPRLVLRVPAWRMEGNRAAASADDTTRARAQTWAATKLHRALGL
jgi:hypothetical protein